MRETWYRLENGEVANPCDVVADAKGKLFKGGVAVAMKGDVPHTIGVDTESLPKVLELSTIDPATDHTIKAREVTAVRPRRTYATRDSKAV